VTGLESEDALLVPAEPGWPELRIVVDPRPAEADGTALDGTGARYPDVPGGCVEVDRRAGVAAFRGVDGLTDDAIVHPRLGMLAAIYAQWLPGRMAFHAGAFVSEERAWAVLGDRFDGKSTLMAALALAGLPVVGDDTLVAEGLRCLPGVRCVDLRPDAAAHLRVGDGIATVRGGMRRRLPLGDAPRDASLAGWVFLAWGETMAVRELPTPERVARIARAQGWHRRGVTEPVPLLEAGALPAWELTRPRDWAHLAATVERVRELTSSVSR
jgi:hypothetical protein